MKLINKLNNYTTSVLLGILVLSLSINIVSGASDESITVNDQAIVSDFVTIDEVVYNGSGWLVIHADNGGSPGTVLGYSAITEGINKGVAVKVNPVGRTDTLFAMLHTDAGIVGTYEFPGSDIPVKVKGVVVKSFSVTDTLTATVEVSDQSIESNKVTVSKVVSSGPGWIAIHADADGSPGTVLGKTAVKHGLTSNIEVDVAEEGRTDIRYAMPHVDNGTIGTYEFPGDDIPFKVDGAIISPSFENVQTRRLAGFEFFTTLFGMLGIFVIFRKSIKRE